MRARTRNFSSSARSHGPITGRGTRVPWKNDVSPPPTNGSRTTTASKKEAKARVAMATHTPPSRRTGSDSRAPIPAAIRAPIRAPPRTGRSKRSTSWKTVNPPIAAKVPWQSEIWPAKPVITVIDRRMVARITAWVIRNSHEASARVNTTTAAMPKKATAKARVSRVSAGLRVSAASDGGGGSTPDIGSDCCWLRRMAGHSVRIPKSTRKGIAGVTFSSIGWSQVRSSAHRGRKVSTMAMPMPRAQPADQGAGEADEPAHGGGGHGHHDQVEEVRRGQGVEAGGDEDAGQAGEEAGEGPAERRDAVGGGCRSARSSAGSPRPPASGGRWR